jgi:hypothetical protein
VQGGCVRGVGEVGRGKGVREEAREREWGRDEDGRAVGSVTALAFARDGRVCRCARPCQALRRLRRLASLGPVQFDNHTGDVASFLD